MASKGGDRLRFLQLLKPAMALLPEVPQAERKVKILLIIRSCDR